MTQENRNIQQLLALTAQAVVKITQVQESLLKNHEQLYVALNETRIQHREQILTLKSTMLNRINRTEAVLEDGMAYLQGQIDTLHTRVNSVGRNGGTTSHSHRSDNDRIFEENNYGPLKRTTDGKVLCNYCSKPLSFPYVLKHMDENVCGGR